jgi:hypothetical protein
MAAIVGTAHIVMQQDEALVRGMEALETGHTNIGGNGDNTAANKSFAKPGRTIASIVFCTNPSFGFSG